MRFAVHQDGKILNAVCTFIIEANSKEEALDKFHKGDFIDSDYTSGDFYDDGSEIHLDDVKEVSND